MSINYLIRNNHRINVRRIFVSYMISLAIAPSLDTSPLFTPHDEKIKSLIRPLPRVIPLGRSVWVRNTVPAETNHVTWVCNTVPAKTSHGVYSWSCIGIDNGISEFPSKRDVLTLRNDAEKNWIKDDIKPENINSTTLAD